MSVFKKLGIFTLLLTAWLTSQAQEFDLVVTVSAPAIQLADPKIFEALEEEVRQLMNTTAWTDDGFEDHERIKGNLQLTITEELSATSFKAELIVQCSRPVFNSSYSTPVMRYLDRNIAFTYDGLRPIQKTEDGYIDNFSSVLSFYAFYMLGMDYDTFSSMGGDPYFEKAFGIYDNLPSSLQRGDRGWSQDDNKQQNRFFLVENARNPRFKRYREASYSYHRQGMDKMYLDFTDARNVIMEAITNVGRVNRENNNSILPRMFCYTKKREVLDIFKVAETADKEKVKSVLLGIDPTASSVLRDLR